MIQGDEREKFFSNNYKRSYFGVLQSTIYVSLTWLTYGLSFMPFARGQMLVWLSSTSSYVLKLAISLSLRSICGAVGTHNFTVYAIETLRANTTKYVVFGLGVLQYLLRAYPVLHRAYYVALILASLWTLKLSICSILQAPCIENFLQKSRVSMSRSSSGW
jgi:hypothetical protein